MLLFKPEHILPILSGRKTETCRLWKRSWAKVGAIHKAKTLMFSKEYFAKLKINHSYKQKLGNITMPSILAEGYYSRQEFYEGLERINKKHVDLTQEVYVVEFTLVEEE